MVLVGTKQGALSFFLMRQRNAAAAKYARGKLLDIGCNHGELMEFLPKNTDYSGIDIHPKISAITFPYRQVSAEDSLAELGKFDSATMIAVIEHLKKPGQAVRNVTKILNKKGRIIITTPSTLGDKLHAIGSKIGLVSSFAAEDHQKIFTLMELGGLLKKNGFTILESRAFLFGLNLLIVGEKN